MLEIFNEYIKKNNLVSESDILLLAISGGIDSIVMLDLVSKAGLKFGIAHCNFKLRGEESDGDEEFVKKLSVIYKVPFYLTQFETANIAKEKGISIQMAARELRYNWFEKIRVENSYNKILLAHQQNDIIETFFINLLRGTGISGLSGIKAKNKYIIRPLLFAKREQLEIYSVKNNLIYREDSSNIETKYIRNKIRHDILPMFNEINPHFNNTMMGNISRLNDVEKVFNDSIEETIKKVTVFVNDDIHINISKLKSIDHLDTFLFSFLKKFSFNHNDIINIIASFNRLSGKKFFSPSHRLIKDRDALIISKIDFVDDNKYYIDDNATEILTPIHLRLNIVKKTTDFVINKDSSIAYIDLDKIVFPIVLRKWKQGDYFMPLGMEKFKKLSHFFIDQKMSIPEKERIWLLSLGNEIIWVVGKRLDNRFKIDDHTKKVLIVSLIDSSK